jgi:hypothetical protein
VVHDGSWVCSVSVWTRGRDFGLRAALVHELVYKVDPAVDLARDMPAPAGDNRRMSEVHLSAVVDFILEIDRLKGVTRKNKPLGQARYENAAEHSWQIALLALSLLPLAPAPVDGARVVEMLLVHDIGEIDTGDAMIYRTARPARLPTAPCAQFAQVLAPFDHGQEVVARQLPQLAGETAGAVGQDDLGLAVAAGVEQDVARRRVAGGVLEADRLGRRARAPSRPAAPSSLRRSSARGSASAGRAAASVNAATVFGASGFVSAMNSWPPAVMRIFMGRHAPHTIAKSFLRCAQPVMRFSSQTTPCTAARPSPPG